MKKLSIIFTLFLIGCGQQGFEVKQIRDVDPLLEPYVNEFEQTYNVTVDYTIKIGELDSGIAGRCSIKGSKKAVTIDVDFFNNYQNDEFALHQLVFHELGHCSLNLDHNSNKNEWGQEVSIMNSYAFGMNWYYENNLDYYINSLRDSRANPWHSEVNQKWGCKYSY